MNIETLSQQKDTLRQEARAHRVRMNILDEDPLKAAQLFVEHIKFQGDKVIAVYYPAGKEFDCFSLLEMPEISAKFTLPVVEKNSRCLKFAEWSLDDPIEKGAFNIPQPIKKKWVEPDIVVVPLLAFDRKGGRLGQGGGYYDATLQDLRSKKDIVAVGFAYSQQACLFNLPMEEHDQKLDWVITPKEAHCFI